MKISLKICIFFFIVSIIHTHYKAFRIEIPHISENRNNLNRLGNIIYKHDKEVDKFFHTENFSMLYGADKPFLFYSPNISDVSYSLIFKTEKNETLKLYNSIEGKIRFKSFQFRLFTLANTKDTKIIEHFCSSIFKREKSIKKITIYVNMKTGKIYKNYNKYEAFRKS